MVITAFSCHGDCSTDLRASFHLQGMWKSVTVVMLIFLFNFVSDFVTDSSTDWFQNRKSHKNFLDMCQEYFLQLLLQTGAWAARYLLCSIVD